MTRKTPGGAATYTIAVQRVDASSIPAPSMPAVGQQQQNHHHHHHQPHSHAFNPSPSHLQPPLHHVTIAFPPPPAAISDVTIAPLPPVDGAAAAQWRSGLMDCCSGGAGMWFDAVFCGSCLYYQMLEELDGEPALSSCCMLRSPCTWLNPFWMCRGHAELRWRIAQRHRVPVSCCVALFMLLQTALESD
jgi:hypothetical protein